ncbi:MAG: nucleotide pyrophosphohydrolase [Saprospiraceae bacterium]|jgi:NTP pyrophosphatase (non-canonical NTP hydrolase)|nr:nucleotide pyrophosphohydrolase [Candidatus Defluviibacterium haderslevense]MBK7242939.1 nucleotide pyrophosphohydrolase [Candidatus Defluviibacterium haderslevense]
MNKLQIEVDTWIKTYGIRYYSELTNLGILMEEVGELARYITRIYGDQSFKINEDALNAKAKISDELADILFVTLCLSNQMNINIEEVFKRKMELRTIRDKERHLNNPKLNS